MAHFASLDPADIVQTVIVICNSDILDAEGNESEAVGIAYCQRLYGADTRWVQTSYNANFRKNYAGIGSRYDAELDAFIPPQPYPSWTLNEETAQWEPPVPHPESGFYIWDEDTKSWKNAFLN